MSRREDVRYSSLSPSKTYIKINRRYSQKKLFILTYLLTLKLNRMEKQIIPNFSPYKTFIHCAKIKISIQEDQFNPNEYKQVWNVTTKHLKYALFMEIRNVTPAATKNISNTLLSRNFFVNPRCGLA